MPQELKFTGERFTPECEREIWYEHMHRYAFAQQFCRSKKVLDAACGEGYGSALIARSADTVNAIDLSAPAIEHASARYGDLTNLEFQQGDVCALPFDNHQFDVIVSFETLEHLENQEGMLAEFRRVLEPDGLLILSSPDKAIYSDEMGFDNEFHVRELYRDELDALLASEFPATRVLGQSLAFHSVISEESKLDQVALQTVGNDGEVIEGVRSQPPVYFIALCAAKEELIPRTQENIWLFDDEGSSVYQHYYHEIRKNMSAGQVLAEKDRQIKKLEEQLREKSLPWWRRWFS